jgi:single-stranded-DNA-specific exonuclease
MARKFNVPSMAVSFADNICTGSMRSARGCNVCSILEQCGSLFFDFGGHQAAGGFTMDMTRWDEFLSRLDGAVCNLEFPEEESEQTVLVDAELQLDYLVPEIFNLVQRFEPYGKENEALIFMAKNLVIREINFIGKPESKHLKMILDARKYKWPALYWQAADRVINREFGPDDKVDALFNITRDYFKGNEIPQMMIIDLKKNGR